MTQAIAVNVADVVHAKPRSVMKIIVTWCNSQWRAILAEFVATVFLIVFGCMSCLPLPGFEVQPPFVTPFGFGLTVMVNIQIFGHLSGAYMNPFVAIIAWIFGRISLPLSIVFIIVECLGAILGYGLLMTMSPYDLVKQEICLTLPHPNLSELQTMGLEIVLTSSLSLINCALWDPIHSEKQDSSPIKFGLTVAVLSLVGGPLSGTSMNPARTLGPAFWTGRWDAHWAYWVGPMVGGILPAIFYKYVWLNTPESKNIKHEQGDN